MVTTRDDMRWSVGSRCLIRQILGGELAPWIQAIRSLEERRRESEEMRINIESDVRDREAYVGRLTQQLQASMEEIKTPKPVLSNCSRN